MTPELPDDTNNEFLNEDELDEGFWDFYSSGVKKSARKIAAFQPLARPWRVGGRISRWWSRGAKEGFYFVPWVKKDFMPTSPGMQEFIDELATAIIHNKNALRLESLPRGLSQSSPEVIDEFKSYLGKVIRYGDDWLARRFAEKFNRFEEDVMEVVEPIAKSMKGPDIIPIPEKKAAVAPEPPKLSSSTEHDLNTLIQEFKQEISSICEATTSISGGIQMIPNPGNRVSNALASVAAETITAKILGASSDENLWRSLEIEVLKKLRPIAKDIIETDKLGGHLLKIINGNIYNFASRLDKLSPVAPKPIWILTGENKEKSSSTYRVIEISTHYGRDAKSLYVFTAKFLSDVEKSGKKANIAAYTKYWNNQVSGVDKDLVASQIRDVYYKEVNLMKTLISNSDTALPWEEADAITRIGQDILDWIGGAQEAEGKPEEKEEPEKPAAPAESINVVKDTKDKNSVFIVYEREGSRRQVVRLFAADHFRKRQDVIDFKKQWDRQMMAFARAGIILEADAITFSGFKDTDRRSKVMEAQRRFLTKIEDKISSEDWQKLVEVIEGIPAKEEKPAEPTPEGETKDKKKKKKKEKDEKAKITSSPTLGVPAEGKMIVKFGPHTNRNLSYAGDAAIFPYCPKKGASPANFYVFNVHRIAEKLREQYTGSRGDSISIFVRRWNEGMDFLSDKDCDYTKIFSGVNFRKFKLESKGNLSDLFTAEKSFIEAIEEKIDNLPQVRDSLGLDSEMSKNTDYAYRGATSTAEECTQLPSLHDMLEDLRDYLSEEM